MFQVRIHGRGGQGAVTAAEMLAVAAFLEGRHAQAFPSFGSERMGAPVMAFCRIDDEPIRLREPVMAPDALIVLDPTLLHQVDVFNGLHRDGYVLINSQRSFEALGLREFARDFHHFRLFTVPATELALKRVGRPLPNVPLLAAFAAVTAVVRLESVLQAIRDRFPAKTAEANVLAAVEAFDYASRAAQAEHA